MARCWFCGEEMIWQNDFNFEDFCLDGEGVVAVLLCSNDECGAVANFIKGD